MLEKLFGREGGEDLSRLGNKALEAAKALVEKAREAGEQGLQELQETAAARVKDQRLPASPELHRPGAVPVTDPFYRSSIRDVSSDELLQRLKDRIKDPEQAARLLLAAGKRVESAKETARASLLGFQHLQGTSLPVAEVLQRVQVRFADGLVSGGKARFLTPQGQNVSMAIIHERYPQLSDLYQAVVTGKLVPQVLLDARAVGTADLASLVTPQLLTHELTHILMPAPYLGDGLREGLTELTAVTLERKRGVTTRADGYELEVAAAQVLVQLNRAAFAGAQSSAETILGHLLTSPRAEATLAGRLKLTGGEEQLLHQALQASDGKTALRNLLKIYDRLAKQSKAPPLDLDALLKALIDPSEVPLVKQKLAGR